MLVVASDGMYAVLFSFVVIFFAGGEGWTECEGVS